MKSISSRLATQFETQPQRRGNRTLVIFLSLKNEIAEAIMDGWSVKSIWQLLNDEKESNVVMSDLSGSVINTASTKKNLTPEKEDFLKTVFKQNNSNKSETKDIIDTSIKRFEYNPVADIKELI